MKGTSGSLSFGDGITSLTFVTNKNIYGPFGCVTLDSFQNPSGQKVTGFFGRACMFLNQLGIFSDAMDYDTMSSSTSDNRAVEGPWGGLGGASFYDGAGDIIEMVVAYNDSQVVSFQTTYAHSGLGYTTGLYGPPKQDMTKVLHCPPLPHLSTICLFPLCVVFIIITNNYVVVHHT